MSEPAPVYTSAGPAATLVTDATLVADATLVVAWREAQTILSGDDDAGSRVWATAVRSAMTWLLEDVEAQPGDTIAISGHAEPDARRGLWTAVARVELRRQPPSPA